jgi:hypothetical protein
MLSGVGQLAFRTKTLSESSLAQELLVTPYLVDFQLNTEDEDAREARAWIEGKRQIVATTPGDQRDRLVISHEYLDWYHLQFARGELATNVTRSLPIYKTGKVPAASPYEIVDTDIGAGNVATITCSLLERGAWGEAGYLSSASGAPTGRQFQPTATGTKLVFPATLAGAAVAYLVNVSYSNIPSIGVADSPVKFGALEFIGKAYGDQFPDGVLIHIPQVVRRTRPNLSTADDVATLEYEFDCQVAPGNREAVHYYLPPAA